MVEENWIQKQAGSACGIKHKIKKKPTQHVGFQRVFGMFPWNSEELLPISSWLYF